MRRITDPYSLRHRFSAHYDWSIRVLQHSRRNVLLPEVIIDYLNEGTTTRNHRRSLREVPHNVLLLRHIPHPAAPRQVRSPRIET